MAGVAEVCAGCGDTADDVDGYVHVDGDEHVGSVDGDVGVVVHVDGADDDGDGGGGVGHGKAYYPWFFRADCQTLVVADASGVRQVLVP